MGSTDLCDGAPENMGRFARRAAFAQVGTGASVETVVSCALAHGVEIFKCSVKRKKFEPMEARCNLFLGYS